MPPERRRARIGSRFDTSSCATTSVDVRRRTCSGAASVTGWKAKSESAGYGQGSALDPNSRKGRQRAAMEYFVEHFEQFPAVVLVCLVRYRDPNPFEGASVYPACQKPAARGACARLRRGTHRVARPGRNRVARVARSPGRCRDPRHDPARPPTRPPRPGAPPPPGRGRLRRRLGRVGHLGPRPRRHRVRRPTPDPRTTP